MTDSQPAAVLWDMDGTIVDTEPYWMAAETELVESFGGTWSNEQAMQLVGQGLHHSARVLQNAGVSLPEDEIISTLTDRVLELVDEQVPWRPGARELLADLRSAGLGTALVTMSMRRLAERVVEAIDFPAFDAVVAGDDVEHSKPHPAPYLLGARLLGVDASRCVAIEDSEPGLASALAAGAVAIGVPAHVRLRDDAGYTLWSTLRDRSAADIAAVYRTGRAS